MAYAKKHPLAIRYQRAFWRTALRTLPHRSLLLLSIKLRLDGLHGWLVERQDRKLHAASLKTYSDGELARYREIADTAKLWHGTGRYQYAGTQTVDVLASIAQHGSLNPVRDAYAVMFGGEEMTSISLTPLRVIARSYADTHGRGEAEPNRYGSSLWWVSYYYGIFFAVVFTRYMHHVVLNYVKWHKATVGQDGARAWGRKVNTKAGSVWDVFGMGSDIPGNYPILFGVARFREALMLPSAMARAEVRLADPVKLTDLSHIEVPEEQIADVRELLRAKGYAIEILPIELGEYAASLQRFDELLR